MFLSLKSSFPGISHEVLVWVLSTLGESEEVKPLGTCGELSCSMSAPSPCSAWTRIGLMAGRLLKKQNRFFFVCVKSCKSFVSRLHLTSQILLTDFDTEQHRNKNPCCFIFIKKKKVPVSGATFNISLQQREQRHCKGAESNDCSLGWSNTTMSLQLESYLL